MSDPVRWGIVSTALINRLVIPPAQASEKVDLVAVASRDQARADDYAREWGIERAHGSYEALLEDPDVEAVYISLPNSLHCPWSIRALEAGKHVLCEKPMSRREAEVGEAFDVAERSGRFLMEAFMYRHNPQTRKVEELVGSGAIGDLRAVRAAFSFSLDDPQNVRLRADVEGGASNGRRLLLRQRVPARRRRARARARRAGRRPDRRRRGLRGDDAVRQRRRRRVRLRPQPPARGTSWR